jgi:hypothetical protein
MPVVLAVVTGVVVYFATGVLLIALSGQLHADPIDGYIAVAAGILVGVYVYRARKRRV